MAHYYLTNMAVNTPKLINPVFESIKPLILSSNQLCQSLLNGPANEHESKLQHMVEQSSNIINSAIQETRKTKHNNQDLDVISE
jgi:hypothetical protein